MGKEIAPQAKGNTRKFSTREISAPNVKMEIFDRFENFRIRDISQTTRIRAEHIEAVIREGIRELRASGAVVNFRQRVDGWGKRKPVGSAVVVMRPKVHSKEDGMTRLLRALSLALAFLALLISGNVPDERDAAVLTFACAGVVLIVALAAWSVPKVTGAKAER